MFTGIIANLGKLIKKDGDIFTFAADTTFCKKIKNGTSVSVNGVCLTVSEKLTPPAFSVEVMPETLNKTMLENLKLGDPVNLELPLAPTEFISGHIVQGHVDGLAKLTGISEQKNSHLLKFQITPALSKFIVEKGSISVNGISLTVIKVTKASFMVGIIPYTWKNTMLYTLKKDDFVNIEVDILAKYLEKVTKV